MWGNRFLVKVALIMSLLTAGIAAYNALWLSPWAIQKQVNMVEDAKANQPLAYYLQVSLFLPITITLCYLLIRLKIIKSAMFIYFK